MKINNIIPLMGGLFLLQFVIASCNSDINFKMKGRRGASSSIAEAKKRGTYIKSYCLENNKIDSLNIKEAFIEKGFGYGKTIDETMPLSVNYKFEKFQFTIKIEEGMKDIYYYKYALKAQGAKDIGNVSDSSIYCLIDSVNIKDTLEVYVLNKVNEKMDTVGILTFKKSYIQ